MFEENRRVLHFALPRQKFAPLMSLLSKDYTLSGPNTNFNENPSEKKKNRVAEY